MDQYIGWLIGAVVVIALVVIAGRSLLGRIVLAWTRWRLLPEEREVFDQKLRLLENYAVVEFLAPTADFQREYGEAEKHRAPAAWLTPWPKVIRAGWKKHKSSAKHVDLRGQVRAAAGALFVAVLPEHRQPSNAGVEHFLASVPIGDRPEEQVRNLKSLVKGKLGLYSVDVALSEDNLSVEFECHVVKPIDRLESKRIGARFFEENPATSPSSLPVAVTEAGDIFSIPLFHTLIYGITGAGKGSVLNAIVRQLSPFVRDGRVVLFGIDPKMEDLDQYSQSTLFEELTTEQEESEQLLRRYYELMKSTQRARKAAREAGRPWPKVGTKENPYRPLMIDEFSSFLVATQDPTRRNARDIMPKFTEIMSQGRGDGFFVIAAAQNIDKDLLGRLRTNFSVGIALRAENEWFNNTLLGRDADKQGFDATLISPANEDNNYRTAGIGYAKQDNGEPVKLRFAFTSKTDVERLLRDWPNRKHAEAATAVPALSPSAIERLSTGTPRRSQVDEIAAVKEWPTARLKAAREKVALRLSQKESVKGRAFLDAMDAELRIRARLASMPKASPGPEAEALPPLGF